MADPEPSSTTEELARILDQGNDTAMDTAEDQPEDEDEGEQESVAKAGYCIECEDYYRLTSPNVDQPAELTCEDCADLFCEVCFHATHRKGHRKRHASKPLSGAPSQKKAKPPKPSSKPEPEDEENWDVEPTPLDSATLAGDQPDLYESPAEWFVERSRWIPLRLTYEERKYLRLIEAALNVSEYTDKVDTLGFGLSKAKRIVQQIRELCAILSGLVLAADYKLGQELFQDRNFEANADFYQHVFELARRHKIMNPEKMRTSYGKLVYVLMDAQIPQVRAMLDFTCVKPIKTVHSILSEHNALGLLRDDLITIATREISSEKRSRREIQKDIRAKERAIETLATRYATDTLSTEMVRQCLYSIGDNNAFLRVNRDPCEKMIEYLKKFFHPTAPADAKSSLAIRSGKGGARLSHDHAKQYAFDGSGADNFFDAGSCIDGRLTSAWNWCSSIEKKQYWPVFLLTGFTSFDGEW
ncbi:hypothetical protein M422DRAFT_50502 [Sphaerobolus stellatus SS14]|uniref:B box-type domain-containing protein n=1 Tax=Sphaerobolus stellatus (strain SS14) TaxID=990650 RepID=A0A0C9URM0_SPHS4|nr:hypothetical protein M422DRAFT_50502 [Sphaerobolus stellatus SS14]